MYKDDEQRGDGIMLKVCDLLDAIDYNRESDNEIIQVCRCGGEWDEVDEIATSSSLLLPLYTAKILCMEAIEANVIRIEIDWDELNERTGIYKWGNNNESNNQTTT